MVRSFLGHGRMILATEAAITVHGPSLWFSFLPIITVNASGVSLPQRF